MLLVPSLQHLSPEPILDDVGDGQRAASVISWGFGVSQ